MRSHFYLKKRKKKKKKEEMAERQTDTDLDKILQIC